MIHVMYAEFGSKQVSWAVGAWRHMEEPEDVKEPREGQKDADLKRGGWTGDSLAFFDGMSLDEVKKILGGVCSTWGLNDFEDLRKEAKRRRRALDVEDHRAGKDPSSGHKDIEWKPQEGKAVLSGKEYGSRHEN